MQNNRFEKFARIFSRRHKQTTFSDAVFLSALRVKLQTDKSSYFSHQEFKSDNIFQAFRFASFQKQILGVFLHIMYIFIFLFQQNLLTLKTPRKPASENIVCLCCLLNVLANFSDLFLHAGRVDPDQT